MRSLALVLLSCLACGPAWAQGRVVGGAGGAETAPDAQEIFFEAVDLKEAGDYLGASGLFLQAIALDPTLYQARLYLAECYHELGLFEDALAELALYLRADFAGKEEGRARVLVAACGGDPDTLLSDPEAPPERAPRKPTAGLPPGPGAPGAIRLESGFLVEAFLGLDEPAAVGPLFALHVLALDALDFQVRVRIGVRERDGVTEVMPDWGAGLALSLPAGPTRWSAGLIVPAGVPPHDDGDRILGGVLAEFGARIEFPDSPLVLGLQAELGFLGHPMAGGSFRVGLRPRPPVGE